MRAGSFSKKTPVLFRTHGFTLVELLVVVGIITILASLLIPALGSARASSRQAQCSNRLGQIGKAVLNATTGGDPLWVNKLENIPDPENEGETIQDNSGILRSLEDHMDRSYAIYKCPDAVNVGYETTIHFGFNGRLSRLQSSDAGKIVALDYGQEIVDFTDLDEWDDLDKGIQRRHTDRANVLFFDGHVEPMNPDTIRPDKYETVKKYWAPTRDERYVHASGDSSVWTGPEIAESPNPEDPNATGRKFTGDDKPYGPPPDVDETPVLIVIDDSEGAPGFVLSAGAGWTPQSGKPLAYLGNTQKLKIDNQENGTHQAEWSFPDLPNGQYKVHATWWYTPSRCTAVYTIGWGDFGNSGGGVLASKECDQSDAPAGFTDEDGWDWEELGTVEVEHGELKVRLEEAIGPGWQSQVADAMRIERVLD